MKPYVTAAPHAEPPTATVAERRPPVLTESRCARRPALHAPRRVPHDACTPHHPAAVRSLRDDRTTAGTRPDERTGRDTETGPGFGVADPGCRRFVEVALRIVLEVLDHRRQPPALRPLLAPTPFDLVTALTRAGAPGRRLGAARLRRVHVHPAGPDRAEIFGSYVRGERTFAIAGRLERAPAARRQSSDAGGGWVLTALQVG